MSTEQLLQQLELVKELIEIYSQIQVEGYAPEMESGYIKSLFKRLEEIHDQIKTDYSGSLRLAIGVGSSKHPMQFNIDLEAKG